VKVSKKLSNGSIKMGYNSEIESITIYHRNRGVETIKQHEKVHNYTTKWRIIYGKW